MIKAKKYKTTDLNRSVHWPLMSLSACQSLNPSPSQPSGSSLTKEINEIHPGILQGYLSKEEIPDSMKLVSAPPERGSAAFQIDFYWRFT
jgi:hypothetical protein